jgi:hypothetical protein
MLKSLSLSPCLTQTILTQLSTESTLSDCGLHGAVTLAVRSGLRTGPNQWHKPTWTRGFKANEVNQLG